MGFVCGRDGRHGGICDLVFHRKKSSRFRSRLLSIMSWHGVMIGRHGGRPLPGDGFDECGDGFIGDGEGSVAALIDADQHGKIALGGDPSVGIVHVVGAGMV